MEVEVVEMPLYAGPLTRKRETTCGSPEKRGILSSRLLLASRKRLHSGTDILMAISMAAEAVIMGPYTLIFAARDDQTEKNKDERSRVCLTFVKKCTL